MVFEYKGIFIEIYLLLSYQLDMGLKYKDILIKVCKLIQIFYINKNKKIPSTFYMNSIITDIPLEVKKIKTMCKSFWYFSPSSA